MTAMMILFLSMMTSHNIRNLIGDKMILYKNKAQLDFYFNNIEKTLDLEKISMMATKILYPSTMTCHNTRNSIGVFQDSRALMACE